MLFVKMQCKYAAILFVYLLDHCASKYKENPPCGSYIQRAMAGNRPYFPKLAFKKPEKIIHEKITSSSKLKE